METTLEFEDPELKWSGKVWKVKKIDPQPPDPDYQPQPGAFKIYKQKPTPKHKRKTGGQAPGALERVRLRQAKEQTDGKVSNG